MSALEIALRRLPSGDGMEPPSYATAASAGLDLMAAIAAPVTLAPGERAAIPTGFALALPDGYEAQVRPRSGLALRHGVTVLNGPGTVDADYRGEVQVILVNLGQESFTVRRGERIAQLVVAPVTRVAWRLVETLPGSGRGAGGFGSTGR